MNTEENKKLILESIKRDFKRLSKSPSGLLERKKKLKSHQSHACTCTSAALITTRQVHAEEWISVVEFDLVPFNINTDSLLLHVLDGLPCPFTYACAAGLRRFLKLREQHPEVLEIVRMSVHDCKGWEIPKLMYLIEDYVASLPAKWKGAISFIARTAFIQTQALYPNGTPIAVLGFNSRFPSRPTDDNRESMKLADKGKENLLDKPFLKNFDSFRERNGEILKNLLETREGFNAVCDKIFADYENTKNAINAAADLGFPDLTDSRLHQMVRRPLTVNTLVRFSRDLRKLSTEEQLRIFATLSRKEEFAFSKPEGVDVTGIPLLRTNAERETLECMYEILISTHYLPSMVVLTCLFSILAETSWNSETALSLTARNIVVRGHKYYLVGVKRKTDSLMKAEIDDDTSTYNSKNEAQISGVSKDICIKDKTAVTAIKLLLANDVQISLTSGIPDNPLFSVVHRKKVGKTEVKRLPIAKTLIAFFKKFHYERFQLSALRKLGARIDYLSEGGNIFTVQALLDHSSPEITRIYLESAHFVELLEANTRRFMKKLEATALFVCGRGSELANRGLSEKDVQAALFPASPNSNAPSVADQWLEETIEKFEVGVAELQFCAYQYRFYRKNYQKLLQENPLRFLRVHFPRLAFCSALRNVILASPHGRLLEKYERKLA
ncbi:MULTISPECIES: hypothetical protein [unclassified Herbaspirillum]|uniref:hypothetical protein n=1 Tax=unclassified Herbaspirillum TaxID=2624150 RepID=UPI0011524B29|nr:MULTISPECIES: hypothetical protein [unclassified Herbaspirillum]MBB5392783.1 integrase [Herbaspirillum sp. SJZ102]TQK04569.1 hypothetical protein FB599_3133 [Herbaspirillum sp. SJZ130]TQK09645.1 hypothetical protein FB598_2628 [Herbaspirillum sp. SJZ106]